MLPPSEGKTPAPAHREPLELDLLHHPELNQARQQVLETLARVSAQPDALEQLKVGKSLAAEVERNTNLLDEPAMDASTVYTGVLYEALNYPTLSPQQQEKADQHILIISALWGVVHPDDVIPAYRLSMGTKLGELGALATYWKQHLTPALADTLEGQLVLDCRSAAYQKALPTAPQNTYEVKVVALQADGSRKVISHMAKHYRGLLARWVIEQQLTETNDIDTLMQQLSQDFEVELTPPTAKKPGALTLVVAAS